MGTFLTLLTVCSVASDINRHRKTETHTKIIEFPCCHDKMPNPKAIIRLPFQANASDK